MATQPNGAGARVPLAAWESVHPAAAAFASGVVAAPPLRRDADQRSRALAGALADANRRWGNPVDDGLARWLAGADAVVTGQQPGLFGGPLLTLVKAAAVAAEVAGRRAAGRDAVGFLWLATADDDLPEMGWARVAVGEELPELREPGWARGGMLGGAAPLSGACAAFIEALRPQLTGENGRAALDLASACYAPGAPLGEATARFLARLLAGSGVVLVDALEPELARAAAPLTARVLENLRGCWDALETGGERMRERGWPLPLRISPHKLPVFRRAGDRRELVPTSQGGCPAAVLAEHAAHPERFLPNAWLRPLVADAALGTAVSILGGAELAYHLQTGDVRTVAGGGRPEWRLRPHVTVVTAAERRLARQLKVGPEQVLGSLPPRAALPGRVTRRRLGRLRGIVDERVGTLAASAREELPGLGGDVEATAKKLDAALAWLDGRIESAATRDAEVAVGRWRRLRAFVRPAGQPQERRLSVLAPLLRLGLEWPRQLAAAVDPGDPGMHLLYWDEGGAW
jgi:uncharacterized protein YllA (UPF0747 family)